MFPAGIGGKKGSQRSLHGAKVYSSSHPGVGNKNWVGLGAPVGNFMPTYYEIEQFFILLPDISPIIVINVWFRFVTSQPFSLSPSAAAPHFFGYFFLL